MKKDDKPDTLAVIEHYNFYDRHTDRRAWRIYDRPRVSENYNNNKIFKIYAHFLSICIEYYIIRGFGQAKTTNSMSTARRHAGHNTLTPLGQLPRHF